MEITEVRVFPVTHRDERLMAFATIILDNSFVVRDLRIIRGNADLFVAMPSRKRSDGTYSDVAHPLNQDLRVKIEEKVIGAYRSEIERHPELAEPSSAPIEEKSAIHSVDEPHRIAV